MKDKSKALVKKVNQVLDVFSPIVTTIFPKSKVPVIIANEIADKISNIDDEVADEVIFGLSESCLYLDEFILDFKATGKGDIVILKKISDNLKLLDKSLDNFYKLIS